MAASSNRLDAIPMSKTTPAAPPPLMEPAASRRERGETCGAAV